MFNRTQINNLTGLVGYENPANPSYKKVDATNAASRSSRYFTDNPYCKIEYILDCQDYKDISQLNFNSLLTKIQRSAIINVCDTVFNNEDLLERDMIFPYEQNKVDLETLPNGFVGFRIWKHSNVAFKINRVFCEFSNTGTFTLLLLTSNQKTALNQLEINVTTEGFQSVPLTNWTVDNTTNYEGNYYLGYIKGDLVPYKRDYQRSNLMAYFKYLDIEQIYVTGHTGEALFDLDDIDGMSANPGINPDITVYNDHTDWILRNEMLIATAVQMAGQIEIMRLIISSGRSNPTERITKSVVDKMMFEIEGNPELKIYGLKHAYEKEISKLKKSFSQEVGLYLNTQTG